MSHGGHRQRLPAQVMSVFLQDPEEVQKLQMESMAPAGLGIVM